MPNYSQGSRPATYAEIDALHRSVFEQRAAFDKALDLAGLPPANLPSI